MITTASLAMRGGADNSQSADLEGKRDLVEAARVGQALLQERSV